MKKIIFLIPGLISLHTFALENANFNEHALTEKQVIVDSPVIPAPIMLFGDKTAGDAVDKNPHRAVPFIAPLAFISYGIMSLNSKPIIRIDHQLNHEMDGREKTFLGSC